MSGWLEYHEEPVTLHSGGRSHWLVRGDLIFADEHLREEVLRVWEDALSDWRTPFEIVGVPTGGEPWAEALRERLGVRPGIFPTIPYLVLVDDVVTTGASINNPHAHVRLAVVDRRPAYLQQAPAVVAWASLRLTLLVPRRDE